MTNYDFLILHHNEFECLTRDILQKKEGCFVESFAEGRDGGIDLRFAPIRGSSAIVQAKRYKDLTSLMSNLQKEVHKVAELRPDRYILAVSVGLTPANKAEIRKVFEPYIRSDEDILGRSDLNNLLGQYPDIEKRYYKLWLGSTAVLEGFVNKRIENWSAFRMEQIKQDVRRYVINESFDKACKILNENRFVIISGIPGIGKSTLANMLAYNYLAEGFDEFIFIAGEIDDVAQKFQDGRKQIFLYDDFLGSNVFEKDGNGFDSKLVALLDRIKRSEDKLLILTTREYVLSAARQEYEKFNAYIIDPIKCTLDLGYYTKSVRAKILYNHLAEADIPSQYITDLLKDRNYKKLIDHHGFNPRLIELLVRQKLWTDVTPERFTFSIVNMFNKPYGVWNHAFAKLPKSARFAMMVLCTMKTPVLIDDWQCAYRTFCEQSGETARVFYDDEQWTRDLMILLDCFVRTNYVGGSHLVDFHNPSVYDFLVEYLRDKTEIQKLLVASFIFEEQFYTLFNEHVAGTSIKLTEELGDILSRRYDESKERMIKCKMIVYDAGRRSTRSSSDKMIRMKHFLDASPEFCRRTNLVERNLSVEEIEKEVYFYDLFEVVSRVDLSKIGITFSSVMDRLMVAHKFIEQYVQLLEYVKEKGVFGQYFHEIMETFDDDFNTEIYEYTQDYECDLADSALIEMAALIDDFNLSTYLRRVDEKRQEILENEANQVDNRQIGQTSSKIQNDISDAELDEMFSSLLLPSLYL